MNKLLAVSACSLFCMSAACAQSTVTIYGIADAGFTSNQGRFASGTRNAIDSGNQSPSRIGFFGSEKLGADLVASFGLESGYNMDDGALTLGPNLLFGRRATVGLAGKFGAVNIGRQDSPLFKATVIFDPLGVGLGGGYTRIFTYNSTFRRRDNTIDYVTPNVRGFTAEAAYNAGEVAGDESIGRAYSASASYAAGPLLVNLSMQNVNSVPVALAAMNTTKLVALGAAYDFGVVKMTALVQTNKANTAIRLDTRDVLIGATLPVGASTYLASYIHHTDTLRSTGGASQFAIAYTYALSKRTNLYTGVSRLENKPDARFGLAAVADGGSVSGTTTRLFTAGVRHLF